MSNFSWYSLQTLIHEWTLPTVWAVTCTCVCSIIVSTRIMNFGSVHYMWVWLCSLCIPLSPPPTPDDLDQFETECEDLFLHFQHRNLDALVAAVRTTLDTLRRRITTRYSMHKHHLLVTGKITSQHASTRYPNLLRLLLQSLPIVCQCW